MDFYKLIEYRKSVRNFAPEQVEVEKLERVLNAARLAPAGTDQAYKFIVVKDVEKRRKLAELSMNQRFVAEAPVVVVICALPAEGKVGGTIPCSVVDASIAVTQMMLAAAEDGLGTCWVGAFEAEPLKQLLNIPQDTETVAILPVGYPMDPSPKAKQRKSLDQLTCDETFQE
jgi:nitroreductase